MRNPYIKTIREFGLKAGAAILKQETDKAIRDLVKHESDFASHYEWAEITNTLSEIKRIASAIQTKIRADHARVN